jgi:hypothetical protein
VIAGGDNSVVRNELEDTTTRMEANSKLNDCDNDMYTSTENTQTTTQTVLTLQLTGLFSVSMWSMEKLENFLVRFLAKLKMNKSVVNPCLLFSNLLRVVA